MCHWILIIAPMDSGFIGPFASRLEAEQYARYIDHDSYVMSESEYAANVREFGAPAFVQSPNEV